MESPEEIYRVANRDPETRAEQSIQRVELNHQVLARVREPRIENVLPRVAYNERASQITTVLRHARVLHAGNK